MRDNDETTPYWFPSKTEGGSVGEDRIVLPIPPGTHWRDAKPLILPGTPSLRDGSPGSESRGTLLPGGALVRPRPEQPKLTAAQKAVIKRNQSKHLGGVPLGKKAVITSGGRVKYVDRTDYVPEADAPDGFESPKPKRAPKPRHKNDPKFIAAARELRDRYLEEVNSLQLPPATNGKYDVSRQLATAPTEWNQRPMLKAA